MGQDLNRCFSKEYVQMSNKYMKRYSASPIIREVKIKTVMRYCFTLAGWLSFFEMENSVNEHVGNYTLILCWWECKMVKLLWKVFLVPPKDKYRFIIRLRNYSPRHIYTPHHWKQGLKQIVVLWCTLEH